MVLISARGRVIAAVLLDGRTKAAPLPLVVQTAPEM
jgi:hypothetical protein